jgi:hypothetical protein
LRQPAILLGCSQANKKCRQAKKLGRKKDKNMKAKTAVEAVMETVAVRVGMNRQHGWGQDDSVAAILAVFECETGDKPDEEVAKAVAMVVNPSAFRQVLEKEKRADGETILAKSEKSAKEKAELGKRFAEFLTAEPAKVETLPAKPATPAVPLKKAA